MIENLRVRAGSREDAYDYVGNSEDHAKHTKPDNKAENVFK